MGRGGDDGASEGYFYEVRRVWARRSGAVDAAVNRLRPVLAWLAGGGRAGACRAELDLARDDLLRPSCAVADRSCGDQGPGADAGRRAGARGPGRAHARDNGAVCLRQNPSAVERCGFACATPPRPHRLEGGGEGGRGGQGRNTARKSEET